MVSHDKREEKSQEVWPTVHGGGFAVPQNRSIPKEEEPEKNPGLEPSASS